jgi:hypothetical protein
MEVHVKFVCLRLNERWMTNHMGLSYARSDDSWCVRHYVREAVIQILYHSIWLAKPNAAGNRLPSGHSVL